MKAPIYAMILLSIMYSKSYADPFDCEGYQAQVIIAPVALLQKLESLPSPVNLEDRVCLELVKAKIHVTIGQSKLALESVNKGKQLIGLDTQLTPLKSKLLIEQARAMSMLGEEQQALDTVMPIIQWAKTNQFDDVLAEGLFVSGLIHKDLGATLVAMQDLQLAYDLTKQVETTVSSAQIAFAIGAVLTDTKDFKNALTYTNEALAYAQQIQILQAVIFTLQQKSYILTQLGQIDQAKQTIAESIQIASANEDQDSVAIGYTQLADIALSQTNYLIAIEHLNKALPLLTVNNNVTNNPAYIFFKLATAHHFLNQDKVALEYIQQANASITDNATFAPLQHSLNRLLAKIEALRGNYKIAYELHTQLENEIKNDERKQRNKEVSRMQMGYESNLASLENKQLKEQNLLQQSIIKQSNNIDRLFVYANVGLVLFLIIITFFLMKIRRQKNALAKIVNIDSLTGISTRSKIMKELEKRLKANSVTLTVALIDLDKFKEINDLHGHAVGDLVLTQFGQLAKQYFAPKDIGRIGGEEFLVCLEGEYSSDMANIFRDFSTKLESVGKQNNLTFPTTASIGITTTQYSRELAKVLSAADQAMYQAKYEGRNQIVMYQE